MTDKKLNIIMLAAENDAIPGGKVGGIGDVMRDVPPALAANGHTVAVIMPAYGRFHDLPGATRATLLEVPFAGALEQVEMYELFHDHTPGVSIWLLEHELFSVCGKGKIYCNDPNDAPFASDANKFALFCTAAAHAIVGGQFGTVDALHLHDWHTAFLAIQREFDPALAALKNVPLVYSIHNLAIQGIRPLAGTDSSLEEWYPDLNYDRNLLADPRWPSCVNPMAAAIRLSDQVHTVSPSYAKEIILPSRVEEDGFYGGEGLQRDLQQAAEQQRLNGILNGCDYSVEPQASSDWDLVLQRLVQQVQLWIAEGQVLLACDYLADRQLQNWQTRPAPNHLVTSIGRLTEQKARLFTYIDETGKTALDRLLESLGNRGVFILLGSGDTSYERFLAQAATRHDNFLFLNHYAQSMADLLYSSGNLFLMPSSFEPCGISQMLSMRCGQPCLVHAIGGLKDTVEDESTGFQFSGDSFAEQGEAMLQRFDEVLQLREQHPVRWQAICKNAREVRFEWKQSVDAYVDNLYSGAKIASASSR